MHEKQKNTLNETDPFDLQEEELDNVEDFIGEEDQNDLEPNEKGSLSS